MIEERTTREVPVYKLVNFKIPIGGGPRFYARNEEVA